MAELLIKATDATHADPAIDRIGCYKRGMVVVVEDDGFKWGRDEGPPNFVVLRVPGVTAEEYRELEAEQTENDAGIETGIPTADGIEPQTYRRRRHKVDLDALPAGIRANLGKPGVNVAAERQIENQIKRIRDGQKFTKKRARK